MAVNFPRITKTVPEYVYKYLSRAADYYSDFLVYAASHAGGLQTQHLFNIQIVKNDILHVLDCIFERPKKDDVFQSLRNELINLFPTIEQEYEKLVQEVTKYDSDDRYKKDFNGNTLHVGQLPDSQMLDKDHEQLDKDSIVTQDAHSATNNVPTFMAEDLSIILPPSMHLPHHVIYISENDKLDYRSLGAGKLVIFNVKKYLKQLNVHGTEISLPTQLNQENQSTSVKQEVNWGQDEQDNDIEEQIQVAGEPPQTNTTINQSIQSAGQKDTNITVEPLMTETETQITCKSNETDSSQVSLLRPKSLKLMLIKQKRFSNELKLEQVVHFLSMKSNYTRQSVCQLKPDEITPQTFRNMKPTLLKGEDGPKPRFQSLKPQQLAKLNEHVYIPKQYEVLSEREVAHAQKTGDFNKFLYFDLCSLEQNQSIENNNQTFSFLPINQLYTQHGTSFTNNISVGGQGQKASNQSNKQVNNIQGIIKHVHSDCIQPFIDIYEDQFAYQFKIDQIVLVYDKLTGGFILGRILMPASRQTRFHCQVQLLYVNKEMLKQRMQTMKKNKKLPSDILRQSIMPADVTAESCLLIYNRFVFPVNIDQSLLEDCL